MRASAHLDRSHIIVSGSEDVGLARIELALDAANDPVPWHRLHLALKRLDEKAAFAVDALTLRVDRVVIAAHPEQDVSYGWAALILQGLNFNRLLTEFRHCLSP